MKKKILILIFGVLLVAGCKNDNELEVKPKQEETKQVKTVEIGIKNTNIATPINIDKLIQSGFVSYSENTKVEKGKCNIEDTIFSENGDKQIKIDYCNYSDNDSTVRFSTIIKMVIDSNIIQINGLSVESSNYKDVIKTLGKDKNTRMDSFEEENKNGPVNLYYMLNDSNNKNTIRLEISFDKNGIINKMIFAYHK